MVKIPQNGFSGRSFEDGMEKSRYRLTHIQIISLGYIIMIAAGTLLLMVSGSE